MLIRVSFASLKDGRWYEYLVRFVLGGAATVLAGVASKMGGAFIGGLFLALPAIFCASATLIEKHEIRRKRAAGLDGRRRGREAAALDAAGAALGGLGLAAFALVFTLLVTDSITGAFVTALAAYAAVSVAAWWLHRTLRIVRWPRRD
jgi:multisubunit Na+/H+ antiporter MnhB subunit